MGESPGNPFPTPQRTLPVTAGRGWKAVKPRDDAPPLLWEEEGMLVLGHGQSAEKRLLGEIGRIDCPLAVDARRKCVYRYVCPDGRTSDYSEIRAIPLETGEHETLFRLGLNQWIVWMMRYLGKEDVLVGMVASYMPGEGIRIQHQLGFFDISRRKRLLVTLPRDAYAPADLHEQRREVLFHGAEGWQVVDFGGNRVAHLRSRQVPLGRGGSMHPGRLWVAVGGGGVALWSREKNTVHEIHASGQNPVWSPDGEALWFSESSSDLFVHHPSRGSTERVLSIAGNPYAEVTMARPPVFSPDGRWLVLPLTRKVKRDGSITGGGSCYAFHRSLVMLDVEKKEFWQHALSVNNPAWFWKEEAAG